MTSIKLQSLQFSELPFRKLKKLTIPFADRITLIAGHNGIGKSTILALTANSSGLTDTEDLEEKSFSYFNRLYQANLVEIIHLDYQKEFAEIKAAEKEFPSPLITYNIDGEALVKRCSLTGRTTREEVRVVPRNFPHKDFSTKDKSVKVGKDAKVPLPTIYLGMTRMLPVGESDPGNVTSTLDNAFPEDDQKFMRSFTSSVISSGPVADDDLAITTQAIKGTRKTAKHASYGYSAKCISLGQDSLSAIATALASFNKLKREWPEYPGGLLVIDELDAGFHPHAQGKLAKALGSAARKLDLQIIATTHSVLLIEALHPESVKNAKGVEAKPVDSVVYIADTNTPYIPESFTLQDIKNDMSLVAPEPAKPAKRDDLKVYFEDDEAAYVFSILMPQGSKRSFNSKFGVRIAPMPLGVGCGNLINLSAHDPYFKKVIIAVDADATVKGGPRKNGNVVKLPGGKDAQGNGLSPERTIYNYIKSLLKTPANHATAWTRLTDLKVTSNHIEEYLLDNSALSDKRESMKAWWKLKLRRIKDWELYELWLAENPDAKKQFYKDLGTAAKAVLKAT